MEDVSYEPSEEKLLIVEQFCAVFGAEWKGKSRILRAKRGKNKVNNAENVGFVLHPAWILHPILHPKSPINKGDFKDWCRKCRRKTQNFFWRRGFGNPKTSDFFEANLRTFEAKHRNFTLKKSDVFGFRTDSNHRRWHFVEKGAAVEERILWDVILYCNNLRMSKSFLNGRLVSGIFPNFAKN